VAWTLATRALSGEPDHGRVVIDEKAEHGLAPNWPESRTRSRGAPQRWSRPNDAAAWSEVDVLRGHR